MKIGIDVHSLGNGKGGNETYYRYLLTGLVSFDCSNEYVLFGAKEGLAQASHIAAQNFRWRPLGASTPYLRIPFGLPQGIRREGVDVFHAQFIVPPFVKCKTVAAIFDIAYEHFPQHFPAYQRQWSRILIRSSAQRADHIVTVSEHSKQDIARTYGIKEDKITVTPLGAGSAFFPRDAGLSQELLAREYRIEGAFILYLGRLQARKNLVRLVDSYAVLRKAGFPHKLVLVGAKDFQSGPVISRVRELKLDREVVLLGYVRNEHIPFFYSAADLFVFPSFYEGFGLPVVEAMACAVPVITSRGSSLEEVAGGAALLIDPNDSASLFRAMQSVLADASLKAHLRRAGLERSAEFSAEKTASKTIAVYNALFGAKPDSAALINRSTAGALRIG